MLHFPDFLPPSSAAPTPVPGWKVWLWDSYRVQLGSSPCTHEVGGNMIKECSGQAPIILPQLLTGLPNAVLQQVREFFRQVANPQDGFKSGEAGLSKGSQIMRQDLGSLGGPRQCF